MTATDFGCKKINETQKRPFSDANIKKKNISKEERYIYTTPPYFMVRNMLFVT